MIIHFYCHCWPFLLITFSSIVIFCLACYAFYLISSIYQTQFSLLAKNMRAITFTRCPLFGPHSPLPSPPPLTLRSGVKVFLNNKLLNFLGKQKHSFWLSTRRRLITCGLPHKSEREGLLGVRKRGGYLDVVAK